MADNRWTEWIWHEDIQRYYSTRANPEEPSGYEYAYDPPYEPSSDTTPTPSTPKPGQASRSSTLESGDFTTRPTATIHGITRTLESTSLNAPPAYGHLTTNNPNRTEERFDKRYKLHVKHEFKWGRVFKCLWSEPKGQTGDGGTLVSGDGSIRSHRVKHGEDIYAKVRRFVIIDRRDGHCICLPIMTYNNQGTAKSGVHPHEHAIIHTGTPRLMDGEKDLAKKPIRVKPSTPQHKLEAASRLNYAKLYTVEYNVKVWFIGDIHSSSQWQLTADYNAAHPPLQSRGYPPTSSASGSGSGYTVNFAAPRTTVPLPAGIVTTPAVTYDTSEPSGPDPEPEDDLYNA